MDKKKIIYIGLLLVITVLVSVVYFSYAFFTGLSEQRGKIHIVTGTLTYEITSSDLDSNNSIMLTANQKKKIRLSVTSLNDISSKYILYYTTAANNFDIGYSSTTIDGTSGIIDSKATKDIIISIQNNNNSTIILSFGVEGGFVNNDLSLSSGYAIISEFDYVTCDYAVGYNWDFSYNANDSTNGSSYTFAIPCDGKYKLEVWGAAGGNNGGAASSGNSEGGNIVWKHDNIYGGYTKGNASFLKNQLLYIYAGTKAVARKYGGGASSIRLSENTFAGSLVVAGGGGASGKYAGYDSYGASVASGNQSSVYTSTQSLIGLSNGGGGGYYAGIAGNDRSVRVATGDSKSEVQGGGGAGYVSSQLDDTVLEVSTNLGDGYARITYLGE